MDGQNTRELTYGEKAVGLTFNPGNNPAVDSIKTKCAVAIDEINDQRESEKKKEGGPNGEEMALFTIAIRDLQAAQMMAVKAATWQH